jgi:hypothetical protein
MIQNLAIGMALIIAICSSSSAEPGCSWDKDRAAVLVGATAWRVAGTLCCCKTYTGGECCTEMAQCGDRPPGCFCATPSVPAPKKTSRSKVTGSFPGQP